MASIQAAVDALVASLDTQGLTALLDVWRTESGPFGWGLASGGGLPFGANAAMLSNNPADDAYAISAGRGLKLAVGGALTVGTAVGGAADSSLLVTDENGDLASGIPSSSVVTATTVPGAPTTGTWQTDQAIIDSNGITWTCTAGGTPGTWAEGAAGNVTDRGAWAATTAYNVHDLVEYGGTAWLCATAHTSGSTFDQTKFTELNSYRGAWQGSTEYNAADTVVSSGSLWTRNSQGTSASTWSADAANWTQITGGGASLTMAALEALFAPGGYSADAHPFPQRDAVSVVDRFRQGYNSPELFTLSTGINEFDLAYVNGNYYMAYDDKQKVVLIHATTIAGLGTATPDGHVGVTSGTSSARYPSIMYDGTNWHLWAANQVAGYVQHYIASTWAGLASASVNDSWSSFTNASDPQVRWNPYDSKWYGGYTNTSTNTIGMLQASSPNGPWTDLGATFGTSPPFAPQQSDPCPIFWNGRAYMAFGCSNGTNQEVAMVELDPSNSYEVVGSPVICVLALEGWQQVSAQKVYGPIFLARPDQPGQERLYYSQNPGSATTAGWGYVQIGPPPPDGRKPLDLLRYDATINFDSAAGLQGALTNSPTYGPNGLAVSGSTTGSSASNVLANPGPAGDFTAEVVFSVTAVPGSGKFGALLIVSTSNSSNNPLIGIWIDNNVPYAEIDAAGGSVSITGSTVISINTLYRLTLRRENGAIQMWLNGVSQGTATSSQSMAACTNWSAGANHFNGATPNEQPLNGAIVSATLMGEAVPLSRV